MAQCGKIQAINGLVTARTPEGDVRELQLGDFVYENEIIETSTGANVSILQADGNVIALKDNDQVFLDESVNGSIDPSDAVVQEVAALQEAIVQALENGEDIDALMEEAAAGNPDDTYNFISGYHAGDVTRGEVGAYLLDSEDNQAPQVVERFVNDADDQNSRDCFDRYHRYRRYHQPHLSC